jgi:hypothetical protein
MYQRFRFLVLLLLLSGWCTLPWLWAATRFNDLLIDVSSMPDTETSHGYLEYVVSVQNLSPATHQVQLILPHMGSRHSGYYEHIREISRTCVVGPLSRVTVSLFHPPLEIYGENMAVIIDGQLHPNSLALPRSRHGYPWSSYRTPHILLSQRLPEELRRLLQEPEATRTSYSSRQINIVRTDREVTQWSKNWLGYTRYDGIVVHNVELEAMPSETFSALWRYVESGGVLLVIGAWRPQGFQNPHETVAGIAYYYVAFGLCMNLPHDQWAELEAQDFGSLREIWWKTSERLRNIKSVAEANNVFPVVQEFNTPVRGLFVLILLFAILIGPVNLAFLNRRKKKIWMLWTVPLISFATCLLVFTYAILAEGWSGQSRLQGLTILDENTQHGGQTTQHATTIGWAGFYSPLTPGDGLHFGYDTELSAQVGNNGWSYRDRSTSSRVLDWSSEQHLQSGWIVARVPAFFTVRKSEAAVRLRLTVSKEHESFVVGNSLGGTIRDLWLADEQGIIYHGNDIAPGQKAKLTCLPNLSACGKADSLRGLFLSEWTEHPKLLAENPATYLQPGCYIAILDASPFIENGLRKTKSQETKAVVYGIRKEAAHED